EHAAAAKATGHEVGVGVVVDQVARRSHLRARLLARQVAARVGRRRVELQRLEREILEVRHADVGCGTSEFQYTGSKRQRRGGRAASRATCSTNWLLGISCAPSHARWRVFCWQSTMATPSWRHQATSAASAILEASGTRVNIDSPNTARPMPTQ